jgi:hypothetical protein
MKTQVRAVFGSWARERAKDAQDMQDIDYAAVAVKTAIVEKFGRDAELDRLEVVANDRTISVVHDDKQTEGTRDNLLAAIRKAESYENLWQLLQASGAQLNSSGPTG